jgi:hypothetical protein
MRSRRLLGVPAGSPHNAAPCTPPLPWAPPSWPPGKALLAPYLPRDGAGGSPYSEGGALYALGLIAANHGAAHRAFLLNSLRAAGSPVIQHGACLGLGGCLRWGVWRGWGGPARVSLDSLHGTALACGAGSSEPAPPATPTHWPTDACGDLHPRRHAAPPPYPRPQGLACLGTCNEEVFEDLKNTLYTDDAVAGEVGGDGVAGGEGLAWGLRWQPKRQSRCHGSRCRCTGSAIHALVSFAAKTDSNGNATP